MPNQTNPVSIKISAFLLLQERNTFNNKRAYKKQNSKSKVAVISLPITRYAISQAVKKSITKNISIVSPSIKYLRSLSFLNTRNLRRLKAGAVVKKI